jgi:hypothetical protein
MLRLQVVVMKDERIVERPIGVFRNIFDLATAS